VPRTKFEISVFGLKVIFFTKSVNFPKWLADKFYTYNKENLISLYKKIT